MTPSTAAWSLGDTGRRGVSRSRERGERCKDRSRTVPYMHVLEGVRLGETESGMVVSRGWGFVEDSSRLGRWKVLERDRGEGCTAM